MLRVTKKEILFIISAFLCSVVIAQPVADGSRDISIKCDGTSAGVISLPDISASLGTNITEFSIEFWCKRYATSATDKYGSYLKIGFGSNKGINIQVPNGNGFTCVVYNEGAKVWKRYAPETDSNLGTWMHVALVYSNSNFKFLVNGSEQNHSSMSGTMPSSIDISGTVTNMGEKLACNVKDLRIWNKALTSLEVIGSMNSYIEPSANLVLNLRMDDKDTPYLVNDNSGNSYNGSIDESSSTAYEDLEIVASGSEALKTKVVGYLPYYRMSSFNPEQFKYLSDVIIFSVVPDPVSGEIKVYDTNPDGTLIFESVSGNAGLKETDIDNIVAHCKANKVKAHLCIGGGDYALPFRELIDNGKASVFAQNVKNLCLQKEIHGVDIDWEFPKEQDVSKFGTLITSLYNELSPEGIQLSGAFSSSTKWQLPSIQSAVNNAHMLDMINVMGYTDDMVGLNNAYNVFVDQYKLPKEKIIGGVPFYTFGDGEAKGKTYSWLLDEAQTNGISVTKDMNGIVLNGVTYNYNGVDLLKSKVEYVGEKLGGIMIWELLQDIAPSNDLSLLKAIYDQAIILEPTAIRNNPILEEKINVYPNPMHNQLTIDFSIVDSFVITFYSLTGKKVSEYKHDSTMNEKFVFEPNLRSGIYFLVLSNKLGVYTEKIVVRK